MIAIVLFAALLVGFGFGVRFLVKEGTASSIVLLVGLCGMLSFVIFGSMTLLQATTSSRVEVGSSRAEPLVEVDGAYLVSRSTLVKAGGPHLAPSPDARRGMSYSFFTEGKGDQVEEHLVQDVTISFGDEATVTRTHTEVPAGLYWPWATDARTRFDFQVPKDGIAR